MQGVLCPLAGKDDAGQSKASRVVNLRILLGLEGCSASLRTMFEGSRVGGTEPERCRCSCLICSLVASLVIRIGSYSPVLGLLFRGGGLIRSVLSSVLALTLSFDSSILQCLRELGLRSSYSKCDLSS